MMAMSWGTSNTSTTDTVFIPITFGNNETQSTQASAWSWRLEEIRRDVEVIVSEKQLRDRAAARAHADAMRAAVRAPPGPKPPAHRARHGHFAGPRLSCHTGTRTR